MAGTAQEWRMLLNPESRDPRVDRWQNRHFLPALEELSQLGYEIRTEDGVFTIQRPKRLTGKCTSSRT